MPDRIKWKAISALACIYVSVIFSLYWLWGILLILWVIQDIRTGATHLFETVPRADHPILFWIIEGSWLALAALLILWDLLPPS